MLHWISTNLSTILITLVLIAIVVLIIRSLIRQKSRESPPAAQGAPTAPCMASATAASRDSYPGGDVGSSASPPPFHPGG